MSQRGQQPSFAVIGAGILGAAVARDLTQRFPHATITLFEKADRVAAHQTGHNSGVLHAGLYYEPGSLKATLCRRGVQLMTDYATQRRLPLETCGKLVVALQSREHERLHAIFERAVANGVPDVELIGPERIRELEPNAIGTLALYSPHTAIIDYTAVTRALIDEVRTAGATLRLETTVTDLQMRTDAVSVTTQSGGVQRTERFDYLISCAGLQSDRVATMAGGSPYPKIVPFFGQYAQLASTHRNILGGLVYPVPDPAYPFLGVHLTKRVDGEMLIGPNAFLALGRENYAGWNMNGRDVVDVVTQPGFWKFVGRNLRAGFRELAGVLSHKRFIATATNYVPSLVSATARPLSRGIRAQAMDEQGYLVDDFVVEHLGRGMFLRNAPSPAATSSLAIAEHLIDTLCAEHGLGAR